MKRCHHSLSQGPWPYPKSAAHYYVTRFVHCRLLVLRTTAWKACYAFTQSSRYELINAEKPPISYGSEIADSNPVAAACMPFICKIVPASISCVPLPLPSLGPWPLSYSWKASSWLSLWYCYLVALSRYLFWGKRGRSMYTASKKAFGTTMCYTLRQLLRSTTRYHRIIHFILLPKS